MNIPGYISGYPWISMDFDGSMGTMPDRRRRRSGCQGGAGVGGGPQGPHGNLPSGTPGGAPRTPWDPLLPTGIPRETPGAPWDSWNPMLAFYQDVCI